MTNAYIPSTMGPDDWKYYLKDPKTQWKKGNSARTIAHCWEDCQGFPPEIDGIMRESETLREVEPLLMVPEWKVPLPSSGPPSQSDVWTLAKVPDGLVSIAVEGKVNEPFGPRLNDWKGNESKQKRLDGLVSYLGLKSEPAGHIHYQLIHRAASAVIMAEQLTVLARQSGAKPAVAAVMLIHSFSPTDKWFAEYCEFGCLFGIDAEIGVLGTAQARNALPLHLGWVRGNERYLKA